MAKDLQRDILRISLVNYHKDFLIGWIQNVAFTSHGFHLLCSSPCFVLLYITYSGFASFDGDIGWVSECEGASGFALRQFG
jgi:hypothetical protein